MSAPNIDRLDSTALQLLADAANVASGDNAYDHFSTHRQELRVALASPEAEELVRSIVGHDELRLAVAVHRCAAVICSAAWTMTDSTPVDLDLIGFAGQGILLGSMVDLLAAGVRSRPRPTSQPQLEEALGLAPAATPAPPGSLERLRQLVAGCNEADEFERGGALRLLADEALFCAGVLSGPTSQQPVDEEIWSIIASVTPTAIRSLRATLPPMATLLDVYLLMGPVWFRMASQNLLYIEARPLLAALAAHFDTARRFLVQVSQGPLAPEVAELFSAAR